MNALIYSLFISFFVAIVSLLIYISILKKKIFSLDVNNRVLNFYSEDQKGKIYYLETELEKIKQYDRKIFSFMESITHFNKDENYIGPFKPQVELLKANIEYNINNNPTKAEILPSVEKYFGQTKVGVVKIRISPIHSEESNIIERGIKSKFIENLDGNIPKEKLSFFKRAANNIPDAYLNIITSKLKESVFSYLISSGFIEMEIRPSHSKDEMELIWKINAFHS